MGAGDIILISQIGAFIGFIGLWFTIMLGSILTAITGLIAMIIYKKTRRIQLPFGAFLAGTAIVFSIYFNALYDLFFTLFLDAALF
jgi:prepilin signal peptidase PulO-like enzyme (type II secretory pathway)